MVQKCFSEQKSISILNFDATVIILNAQLNSTLTRKEK